MSEQDAVTAATDEQISLDELARKIADNLLAAGVSSRWFRQQGEDGQRAYLVGWLGAWLERYLSGPLKRATTQLAADAKVIKELRSEIEQLNDGAEEMALRGKYEREERDELRDTVARLQDENARLRNNLIGRGHVIAK